MTEILEELLEGAPDWAVTAHRLVIREEISVKAAARRVGKHHSSVRYWLVVGEMERQKEIAQRWREDHPERARARGRRANRKKRREDPEGVRRYVNAYNRRPERKEKCVGCGGPRGIDVRGGDGRCKGCVSAEAEARRQKIEALWNEGWLLREIAEEMETTPGALASTLRYMRESGNYVVPPRRAGAKVVGRVASVA